MPRDHIHFGNAAHPVPTKSPVHVSRFKALRSPEIKIPFYFVGSSLPQTYVTLEAFFLSWYLFTSHGTFINRRQLSGPKSGDEDVGGRARDDRQQGAGDTCCDGKLPTSKSVSVVSILTELDPTVLSLFCFFLSLWSD